MNSTDHWNVVSTNKTKQQQQKKLRSYLELEYVLSIEIDKPERRKANRPTEEKPNIIGGALQKSSAFILHM